MLNSSWTRRVLLILCLACGASVQAAQFHVDTFDVGSIYDATLMHQGDPTYHSWSKTETGLDTDEVAGGTRQFTMQSMGAGTDGSGSLSYMVSGGIFKAGTQTDSDVYYGRWILSYVALSATERFDLTGGGTNDAFQFDFSGDGHHLDIEITVVDGDGDSDSYSEYFDASNCVYMPFSRFSASVDFDDIDQISIQLTGQKDGDYELTCISTNEVPEPFTLALLGVGTMGLVVRRRRRV